jgi:hypothetical protein
MNMPRLFPLDVNVMSLHACDSGQNFRVVILQISPANAQNWTVTNRGNGRYAISTNAVDGTERFLTGQANGGPHLYALPQDPDFEFQTWRRDQGPAGFVDTISMGLSGRFLQGDCGDSLAIEVDNNGGFDVDLVRSENLGRCSGWGSDPDVF